jgi:hypothetical protein
VSVLAFQARAIPPDPAFAVRPVGVVGGWLHWSTCGWGSEALDDEPEPLAAVTTDSIFDGGTSADVSVYVLAVALAIGSQLTPLVSHLSQRYAKLVGELDHDPLVVETVSPAVYRPELVASVTSGTVVLAGAPAVSTRPQVESCCAFCVTVPKVADGPDA